MFINLFLSKVSQRTNETSFLHILAVYAQNLRKNEGSKVMIAVHVKFPLTRVIVIKLK